VGVKLQLNFLELNLRLLELKLKESRVELRTHIEIMIHLDTFTGQMVVETSKRRNLVEVEVENLSKLARGEDSGSLASLNPDA
jgi:hypothetical protein